MSVNARAKTIGVLPREVSSISGIPTGVLAQYRLKGWLGSTCSPSDSEAMDLLEVAGAILHSDAAAIGLTADRLAPVVRSVAGAALLHHAGSSASRRQWTANSNFWGAMNTYTGSHSPLQKAFGLNDVELKRFATCDGRALALHDSWEEVERCNRSAVRLLDAYTVSRRLRENFRGVVFSVQ